MTTRSYDSRSVVRIWSTWSAVMSSASSGDVGAARTWRPLSCRVGVRPEQLGLAHRGVVAGDVGQRLLRLDVEVASRPGRTGGGGRRGRPGPASRGPSTIATFVATVVVPTPPFGLWTATVRRWRVTVSPSVETTAREVLRALEPEQQGLDAGLELAGVERLRHDVVGAGLEEADPLLDVVGLADAEDRDRGERGRRADLAADVERGLLARDDVDDRELVVGDLPNASSGSATVVTV